MKRAGALRLLALAWPGWVAWAGWAAAAGPAVAVGAGAVGVQVGIAGDSEVERLGDPWAGRYPDPAMGYARNIWDLRWFGDRLYVGGGNSSNHPPASNAGPVPILAYSAANGRWDAEGQVEDEQIDRFVELDGQLAIPGHDPRESWRWGNLYLRGEAGTWRKLRRIPDAVHTYDLFAHSDGWFAALGTAKGGAIAWSGDRGRHWQTVQVTPARMHAFVAAGETLFAVPVLRPDDDRAAAGVLRWQGAEGVRGGRWQQDAAGTPAGWFPDTRFGRAARLKVAHAVALADAAVYIGARVHNDHQFEPIGAYVGRVGADGGWRAVRIPLPPGYQPWDVVAHEGAAWLLLNRRDGSAADVLVWRVDVRAPERGEARAAFRSAALARALALRADAFYIGLGHSFQDDAATRPPLPRDTGAVLRVRPRATPVSH